MTQINRINEHKIMSFLEMEIKTYIAYLDNLSKTSIINNNIINSSLIFQEFFLYIFSTMNNKQLKSPLF